MKIPNNKSVFVIENAPASAFPVATRLELVDKSCCGVSERTTINMVYIPYISKIPCSLLQGASILKFGISL